MVRGTWGFCGIINFGTAKRILGALSSACLPCIYNYVLFCKSFPVLLIVPPRSGFFVQKHPGFVKSWTGSHGLLVRLILGESVKFERKSIIWPLQSPLPQMHCSAGVRPIDDSEIDLGLHTW